MTLKPPSTSVLASNSAGLSCSANPLKQSHIDTLTYDEVHREFHCVPSGRQCRRVGTRIIGMEIFCSRKGVMIEKGGKGGEGGGVEKLGHRSELWDHATHNAWSAKAIRMAHQCA